MTEIITDREELNLQRNLATDIVTAFVANNPTTAESLTTIVKQVFREVANWGVAGGAASIISDSRPVEPPAETAAAPAAPARPEPAVSIKKSVTPDYIFCLEDGKQFKSLKRHLATSYSMTPNQYRERWGLPADYPMVAPNYAKQRSELAKHLGLGRNAATARRGRRGPPVEQPAEAGE